MNIRKLAYTALATAGIAFAAAPAHATLILTLDAGNGNIATFTDNDMTDMDDSVGTIAINTSLGTWAGILTGGFSNAPGDNGFAVLELDSAMRSRGSGTLTITLVDTGFTTPSGVSTANTLVSGLSLGFPNGAGTSSFNSLVNNTNVSSQTFGSNNFGGTTGANVDTTGGFTLTQVATITHQGAGLSSFQIMTTVPEPATLGLLGLGLLALGFVKRRRGI